MNWDRVRDVFLAAVERPEAERDALLAELCAGDDHLRQEVESLLASDARAGSFCERPAAALLARGTNTPGPGHRLQVGARVGAYEITGFVGAGGMGDVYRARHTLLGRDVAVKCVRAENGDDSARQRLIREARHASGLRHRGICTIYEVITAPDGPLIVMELVEGRPLAELLRAAPLAHGTVLDFGCQVAQALEHAHRHGIVHRDLKSSNVVIDGDGRAVVLDFGLAQRLPGVDSADRTTSPGTSRSGTVAGTLGYMSPEVLRGRDADERSDIWALGIVLYEMLAGRLPFRGSTEYDTASAILSGPLPPLDATVPLPLRRVVERCLAREPAARFQHAAEVAQALDVIRRRRDWPLVGPLLGSVRRRTALAGSAVAGIAVIAAIVLRTTVPAAPSPAPQVVVADFANLTSVDHLATAVTEALLIDLSRSAGVRAASKPQVAAVLKRMGLDTATVLSESMAREVAVREGYNAVLRGEVVGLGNGYMISAQLVSADSGQILFAARENARDADDIIPAVDRLSAGLRKRLGETLQSARAHRPLEAVTTGSIEALKLYSAAMRLVRHSGGGISSAAGGLPGRARVESDQRVVELLEQAIALDSTFAAAYRALAMHLHWTGDQPTRSVQLLTRAYELRQRLTERERLLTEGTYFDLVTADQRRAVASFNALLDLDGSDVVAIQHLALAHFRRQDFERAIALYERDWAMRGGAPAILYTSALLGVGRLQRADSILQRFAPSDSTSGLWLSELIRVRAGLGDFAAVDTLLPRLHEIAARSGPSLRSQAAALEGSLKIWRGRYSEGVAQTYGNPPRLTPFNIARLARFDVYVFRDPARARRRLEAAYADGLLESGPTGPYAFLARVYAAAGDPDRAREFNERAQAIPHHNAWDARGTRNHTRIDALVSAAAGDIGRARHLLNSAERELGCWYTAWDGDMTRAEIEGMAGHPDSVFAALERVVAMHGCKLTLSWSDVWGPVSQAYAHERLAELYDARGDLPHAGFHYARFVELWPDPDPELRPRWRAAMRRLKALDAEAPSWKGFRHDS